MMIVFDIDGTISDLQHRLHHIEELPNSVSPDDRNAAYRAFFASCAGDDVIPQAKWIHDGLSEAFDIFFLTGRSDECRSQTIAWLIDNEFCLDYGHADACLYMRQEGDHRPDTLVKAELMDQLIADQGGATPSLIFEDRDSVVKMWRERGYTCYQVAPGDF